MISVLLPVVFGSIISFLVNRIGLNFISLNRHLLYKNVASLQQPWFHYVQEEDSALCFYCATAVQRKMPMTRHTDKAFTETGFITGEKPCINSGNVSSLCHWYAVGTIRKNSKDVGEMLSTAHIKKLCICILFYLQYASLLTEDYLCMGVMSVTGVVNPIATLHSFYNRTKMMCLMAL